MSEKKNTLGKAVAVAAGVGAAYLALKKKENEKQVLEQQAAQNSNYRNTERGKYDKNSKGIYYTMVITKHSQDLRSQKALMKSMPIS